MSNDRPKSIRIIGAACGDQKLRDVWNAAASANTAAQTRG
jgi:hypothetical protein